MSKNYLGFLIMEFGFHDKSAAIIFKKMNSLNQTSFEYIKLKNQYDFHIKSARKLVFEINDLMDKQNKKD